MKLFLSPEKKFLKADGEGHGLGGPLDPPLTQPFTTASLPSRIEDRLDKLDLRLAVQQFISGSNIRTISEISRAL